MLLKSNIGAVGIFALDCRKVDGFTEPDIAFYISFKPPFGPVVVGVSLSHE
jgi:hypothetical protein